MYHSRPVSVRGGGGGGGSYRCFLTLDGGAVEAEGGHVVGLALDVKDALVVPLTRLGLGEVLGGQRDRLGHPDGDVDLGGGQNLWTVLRREGAARLSTSQRSRKTGGGTQHLFVDDEGEEKKAGRGLRRGAGASHTFSLKSCAVIHCSHVFQACETLRGPPARSQRLATSLEPGRTLTGRDRLYPFKNYLHRCTTRSYVG